MMSVVEDMEEPRNAEVFRGHLDECIRHLAKCLNTHAPPGLKGAEKARQPIADFCGVVVKTVSEWIVGRSKLIGEQRIKMMCCLDMLGYRVTELERLTVKRELAELIGYGIMDVHQIATAIGYKNSNDVFRIVTRQQKRMDPDRAEKLWTLLKEKRPELGQKKREMRERCQLGFSLMDAVHQRKVSAVVSIMEGLLSLLESKDVGEAFANSLTDLPPQGKDTFLKLSESLHDLSMKLVQKTR
jgi:hypothetical protein